MAAVALVLLSFRFNPTSSLIPNRIRKDAVFFEGGVAALTLPFPGAPLSSRSAARDLTITVGIDDSTQRSLYYFTIDLWKITCNVLID